MNMNVIAYNTGTVSFVCVAILPKTTLVARVILEADTDLC